MIRPHELVSLLQRAISCDYVLLIEHYWASNRLLATTWPVEPQDSSRPSPVAIVGTHALISLLWKAPLLDPTAMPGTTNQILMVTGRRAPVDGLDGEAVGWQIQGSKGFKPDDLALLRTVRSLFEQPVMACTSALPTRLTATETAVLVLIAEGYSDAEIAHHRGRSVRTVHKHVENIYRKIGCNDRVRAAQYALQAGLIDFAPPGQSADDSPDTAS